MGISAHSQVSDWNNGGGNPARNGFAFVNGPEKDSILWQAAPDGMFGMPGYIEGNKFVTMRFLGMTNAPVECYNLNTGELLWSKEVTGLAGRSLPIGFRDGQVYVMRLTENQHDTLYALNAVDGSKIWTADITINPYITASANFASNGDLFVESYFKMNRIDYRTGELIWETNIMPFVMGVSELSAYNNTGYVPEQVGGVAHIVAYDLETGQKKYSHPINDNHPGGGINECPVMIGQDGTIFFHKQGDNVTALSDDGSGFTVLWETEIFGNSPFSHMCVGSDGSVYAPSDGRVIRLDPKTGAIRDTSTTICSNPELFQMRASAAENGIIYVTNGENGLYAFTLDLKEIWNDYIPNVNTSGAVIGTDGVVAVSGTDVIKVYTPGIYAGFDEPSSKGDICCFPNPAVDWLNIVVSEDNSDSEFTVYDCNGRAVLQGRMNGFVSKVDLGQLSTGLYQVRLNSKSNISYIVIKL
jgi:outer membrane protein assembly factor BamB